MPTPTFAKGHATVSPVSVGHVASSFPRAATVLARRSTRRPTERDNVYVDARRHHRHVLLPSPATRRYLATSGRACSRESEKHRHVRLTTVTAPLAGGSGAQATTSYLIAGAEFMRLVAHRAVRPGRPPEPRGGNREQTGRLAHESCREPQPADSRGFSTPLQP